MTNDSARAYFCALPLTNETLELLNLQSLAVPQGPLARSSVDAADNGVMTDGVSAGNRFILCATNGQSSHVQIPVVLDSTGHPQPVVLELPTNPTSTMTPETIVTNSATPNPTASAFLGLPPVPAAPSSMASNSPFGLSASSSSSTFQSSSAGLMPTSHSHPELFPPASETPLNWTTASVPPSPIPGLPSQPRTPPLHVASHCASRPQPKLQQPTLQAPFLQDEALQLSIMKQLGQTFSSTLSSSRIPTGGSAARPTSDFTQSSAAVPFVNAPFMPLSGPVACGGLTTAQQRPPHITTNGRSLSTAAVVSPVTANVLSALDPAILDAQMGTPPPASRSSSVAVPTATTPSSGAEQSMLDVSRLRSYLQQQQAQTPTSTPPATPSPPSGAAHLHHHHHQHLMANAFFSAGSRQASSSSLSSLGAVGAPLHRPLHLASSALSAPATPPSPAGDLRVVQSRMATAIAKRSTGGSLNSSSGAAAKLGPNRFRCGLCNVVCWNQYHLDEHYKGRGHRRSLRQLLRRSVIVSGVPFPIATHVLQQFFVGLTLDLTTQPVFVSAKEDSSGPFQRVAFTSPQDAEKALAFTRRCVLGSYVVEVQSASKPYECTDCDIVLNSAEQYEQHLTGAKHKQRMQMIATECTVALTGLPAQATELDVMALVVAHCSVSPDHVERMLLPSSQPLEAGLPTDVTEPTASSADPTPGFQVTFASIEEARLATELLDGHSWGEMGANEGNGSGNGSSGLTLPTNIIRAIPMLTLMQQQQQQQQPRCPSASPSSSSSEGQSHC